MAAQPQPAACTLDAPAFRVREDEFRKLFAQSLRGIERRDARSARLFLDSACEADVRDLLAREIRCCSFFEFELEPGSKSLELVVRVPAGSEDALAFLLDLTDR